MTRIYIVIPRLTIKKLKLKSLAKKPIEEIKQNIKNNHTKERSTKNIYEIHRKQ